MDFPREENSHRLSLVANICHQSGIQNLKWTQKNSLSIPFTSWPVTISDFHLGDVLKWQNTRSCSWESTLSWTIWLVVSAWVQTHELRRILGKWFGQVSDLHLLIFWRLYITSALTPDGGHSHKNICRKKLSKSCRIDWLLTRQSRRFDGDEKYEFLMTRKILCVISYYNWVCCPFVCPASTLRIFDGSWPNCKKTRSGTET